MKTRISKWSNSLAMRIPKAQEAGPHYQLSVELSLVDGKLVIAPIEHPRLSLETMLAQITEDNVHSEVNSCPAVGKEA